MTLAAESCGEPPRQWGRQGSRQQVADRRQHAVGEVGRQTADSDQDGFKMFQLQPLFLLLVLALLAAVQAAIKKKELEYSIEDVTRVS